MLNFTIQTSWFDIQYSHHSHTGGGRPEWLAGPLALQGAVSMPTAVEGETVKLRSSAILAEPPWSRQFPPTQVSGATRRVRL